MTSTEADTYKIKFEEIMNNTKIHRNQKIVAADAILDLYNASLSKKDEEEDAPQEVMSVN